MRKIVTLLTLALLPMLAASADVYSPPYNSGIGGDTNWTVIDANNDNNTWEDTSTTSFSETPYGIAKKYKWHISNPGDDWCISPAIHLEAGKEYKVCYWLNISYSGENIALYMANASTPEALKAGTKINYFEDKKFSPSQKIPAVITVNETGDYYFGFHCYSQKNKMNVYICGFEVRENLFAPGAPTALTCVADPKRTVTATLKWALPTVDVDGAAFPEGVEIESVNIKRDNQLVATLAGTETTWTDTEALGLTPGYHSYAVNVTANGVESYYALTESPYIGPQEAKALPFKLNPSTFSKADFELDWTTAKGEKSTTDATWQHTGYASSGYYMSFYPGASKIEDDWLISPQMNFAEAGVYKFTVALQYNTSPSTDFDILFGKGYSTDEYSLIANFKKIPGSETTYSYYLEIDEPGNYAIAFHNKSTYTSYYTYCVKKFEVEKWITTPAQIEDLTATVNDDATVTLSWTNPTKSNTGKDLTDLVKVDVYCNGELVKSIDTTEVGKSMSYVHTPEAPGSYKYYVLAYSSEGAAEGTPKEVKSAWVGDETQYIPYYTKFANDDATLPFWTSVDADNDGNTFTPTPNTINNTTNPVLKKYTFDKKTDDYLVSPVFDLPKGYYQLSVNLKGATENYQIGFGLVSDKENVADTYQQFATVKLSGSEWEGVHTPTLTILKGGKFAIAIHANDMLKNSGYDLTVTKFEIKPIQVIPSKATELKVEPAADHSLSATISWRNPSTTNVDGVAPQITKVVVYRNDQSIAEVTENLVAGELSSYVDKSMPNAGVYTYKVEVFGENGSDNDGLPSVKSDWIGNGLSIPWDCTGGFNNAGFTMYNVNDDDVYEADYDYYEPLTWVAGRGTLSIQYPESGKHDDWAVSPRLDLSEGEYLLKVTHYYSASYDPVEWDLHIGTTDHYNSMHTLLSTIKSETTISNATTSIFKLVAIQETGKGDKSNAYRSEDENEDNYTTVNIPAGVSTLGFHANKKGQFSISALSIEPYSATGVEAVKNNISFTYANNTLYFGEDVENVEIFTISGERVMAVTNVDHVSIDMLSSGAYICKVINNGEVAAYKLLK